MLFSNPSCPPFFKGRDLSARPLSYSEAALLISHHEQEEEFA
jgi:hypothetical protein